MVFITWDGASYFKLYVVMKRLFFTCNNCDYDVSWLRSLEMPRKSMAAHHVVQYTRFKCYKEKC